MAEQIRNNGFFPLDEGPLSGKSLSSLKNSRATRAQLKALFGEGNLPSSIMRAEKGKPDQETDKPTEERSYTKTSKIVKGSKKFTEVASAVGSAKLADRAFLPSGRGCGNGALSTFPQNVGRTVLLMYSEPGHTVFDPFAGHNSRMDLCVRETRHYVGCDLSHTFMEFNRARAKVLRKQYPKIRIELHEGDSRKVPVKDEVGDFTITSPPYYDIEYYGDEPEQMANHKTYAEFLDSMQRVMRENFRCLKPGAFAAWFINDFRRDGVFHSYHSDIIRLGTTAGFVQHDLMVVDFGPGLRDIFLNQSVQQKILPKRHEFGVIFRKP